jgi:uncharacterized cofD-like protein
MPNLTRFASGDRNRQSPYRVVSIGGGTGLSTLLSGLKRHAVTAADVAASCGPSLDITAVVTVTDDGGSSGRLRRDFDILPPGDIRNCMTALSEDTDLLSQLFRYRFASGRGLKGHSFGNLFLTAMHQITGDFAHAVKLSCEILAIRGRIFPSTSANVVLVAELEDGTIIRGETRISKSSRPIRRIRLDPEDCQPLPETLDAIRDADLITLGPGSLYTSLIPNLLVRGIAEAIERSSALKVYFVNLMWQPGETINFTASHHLETIMEHAKRAMIDCVVLNTGKIPLSLKRKYASAHVQPVENDFGKLERLGVKVVTADLVGSTSDAPEKVRHSPTALADIVMDLASRSRAHLSRRELLATQRTRIR